MENISPEQLHLLKEFFKQQCNLEYFSPKMTSENYLEWVVENVCKFTFIKLWKVTFFGCSGIYITEIII